MCALKLGTVLDEDGRIARLAARHDLAYEKPGGRTSPRIEAFHGFMKGAGFPFPPKAFLAGARERLSDRDAT